MKICHSKKIIAFDALVTPVALGRPHINTTHGGVYYRSVDRHFHDSLAWIARAQMKANHFEPLEGAIAADIKIFRNIKIVSRNFGDIDNHLKAIFDALNGICYADDAQIVSVHCEKLFDKGDSFIRLRFYNIEGAD